MASNEEVVVTNMNDGTEQADITTSVPLAADPASTIDATISVPTATTPPTTTEQKISRPSFKAIVVDETAGVEKKDWKEKNIAAVRNLIGHYANKVANPDTVLREEDAAGNKTGKEITLEMLFSDLVETTHAVTDRGDREVFVKTAMETALAKLPKEGKSLIHLSKISIAMKQSLKEQPLAPKHAESSRIAKAVQGFFDEVVGAEHNAIYNGAKESLLEVLRAGGGEATFFRATEFVEVLNRDKRDGSKKKVPRWAGDFRVRVSNKRVFPVMASESHRELFEEMKDLKIFVSLDDLQQEKPDFDRRLPPRKFTLLRVFHSVLYKRIGVELEAEKKAKQAEAAKASAEAAKEAKKKERYEARERDKAKTLEMESREGLIDLGDLLLRDADGDVFFHVPPEEAKNGTEIPAFTVHLSGKRYYHVAGILRRSGVNVAVVDCLPSNEELFTSIRELMDPGEKFVNVPDPAGIFLRRLYGRVERYKAKAVPKGAGGAEEPTAKLPVLTVQDGTEETTDEISVETITEIPEVAETSPELEEEN